MSLSTLFKSNVIAYAHTSEGFLKLTRKCVERVLKMTSKGFMFTSPKFNYEQCKYLADKLKLVVESAETLPPEDITNCFEIIKLVHGFANLVENYIQSCCQDRWIQVAMTITNFSEHISLVGFYLEAVSQSFLGDLTSTFADGICQSEGKIVEEKASYDRETLLRNLTALLQTKSTTWKVHKLATLLLERLQHSQRHKDGSVPRFFQNIKDNLEEKEKLGRGSFATVFKASWLGIEAAKKTFYARDSPDFENEVSILQTLSHPNITSLFGYAKDDQECFMIMELMDEDLFYLIRRRMKENKTRGYPFDIFEAMDMMLQIGGGMKYLHEMRIVHRDLKSMNILVKYVKTSDMKIAYVLAKVSDFGLARIKQKSSTESDQTPNMGTARWMAPEMIKLHLAESPIEISNTDANDVKVAKHPFKSDVYSFAMVCYEILSGELPYFEEHNLNEVKRKVLRGDRPQLPNHSPPEMKSLIEKCWDADASKRPSFIEIFAELQQLQCLLLMSRSGTDCLRVLSDGTWIALDRLLRQRHCIIDSGNVQAEIKSLSIRETHPNLLLKEDVGSNPSSFLHASPHKSNGTVRSQLQKVYHGEPALSFKMRKRIALGVAKGLAYLHEECRRELVHRDVKSGNIVVDGVTEVIGCVRYVSWNRGPARNCGFIMPEHDVFSFGIALLILITARTIHWRATEDNGFRRVHLLTWVEELAKVGKLESIVDSNLKEYNVQDMKDLLQVALFCTQRSPSARPKLSEVVSMLQRTTLTSIRQIGMPW